ncbi:MAG: hypothetical protein ACOYT4_03970 [Nanoarchaeota archaeon]
MEEGFFNQELITIILASLILGWTVSLFSPINQIYSATICFFIIIVANIFIKKAVAYYYEANVKTKFWSWTQYGFSRESYFKNPLPMFWLPLVLGFISRGYFFWLGILEFDISPRVERISKRHDLYKFTELAEWHVALIAVSGIIINLLLAVIGYIIGFEFFAKLNVYYALWSVIPLGGLDGSKILFGNKTLWFATFLITMAFFIFSVTIV